MVSSLVFILALAGQQTQPQSDGKSPKPDAVAVANDEMRKEWTEALNRFCEIEGVSMVFDVNLRLGFPGQYQGKHGIEGAKRLALFTNRKYKEIEGVQFFMRDIANLDANHSRPIFYLADFLRGLPADAVSRLVDGGLPLSMIPAEKQSFIRYLCASNPSMRTGLAMSDWEHTVIKLGTSVNLVQSDAKGNKTSIPVLPKEVPPPITDEQVSKTLAGTNQVPKIDPFGPKSEGPLEFEPGRIITLDKLVKASQEKFGESYVYDMRLAESELFVRGSFSSRTLSLLLKSLTTTTPIRSFTPEDKDPKQALRDLLSGPLASLATTSMSDFINGDATLSDLMKGRDGIAQDFLKGNSRTLDLFGSRLDLTSMSRLEAALTMNMMTLGTEGGKKTWIGGVPTLMAGY